jgi:hypothetical protein
MYVQCILDKTVGVKVISVRSVLHKYPTLHNCSLPTDGTHNTVHCAVVNSLSEPKILSGCL